MDRLKSFVTEPTVTTEQKNQPRRTIKSFHRFFASSNHAHFAQVDADDRRFVFLKVSSARQGDLPYWEKVHAAVNNPSVIAAAVFDLLSIDLSGFNVRQRPKTKAHLDQKLRSLSGFDRYWYEVLQTGGFFPGTTLEPITPWSDPKFEPTNSTLQRGLEEYQRGQRQFAAPQQRDIHDGIKRLCPSAKPCRQKVGCAQARGYMLPSIATARQEFDLAMGGAVTWED